MAPGDVNDVMHKEAWAEEFLDLRKSSELSSCLRTRESRF